MNEEERNKKITEFEAFVNDRLKVDLEIVLKNRDEIFAELNDYLELKNNILLMKENNLKSIETMVNLGSQIYCKAKVDDTSKIFVNLGFGFHVELTFDEAIEFIEQREVLLTRKADHLTVKSNEIRDRIRLIYDTLEQLLQLPTVEEIEKENKKPKRVF